MHTKNVSIIIFTGVNPTLTHLYIYSINKHAANLYPSLVKLFE